MVLFELSEFLLNFTFRVILTLLRCEKTFRLLHLYFELFHLIGEIVFPFRLERLNNLLFCPLSVRFYSNLSSYSIVNDLRTFVRLPLPDALFPARLLTVDRSDRSPDIGRRHCRLGRSGWTRTIDLALIRRAL